MAYSEELAKRIDSALTLFPDHIRRDVNQKKMFGGIAFLYKGKMTVGIIKDELVVRVVEEKMAEILARTVVRPMDFTNKPMKEFVFVAAPGFESENQLQYWMELGLEHARRKLGLD